MKVAVIGAGHWGPNLVRNFDTHKKTSVAWVIDQNQDRLELVKPRFPTAQLSANADDALSDPEVQAVVVATPTSTHYEIVEKALQRGKHVLVEKPITTDGEQARKLCELAEKQKLVLMVGHVFLFNPAVQKVKDYLKAGDLGRLHYVSMVRTNLGPVRMDVNAAWDLAAHDISIVNYWLDAKPTTASAVGGNWINEGIEDAIFATLRYPNDVLVNLHASWLNPRKARDITVVGDARMLTLDDMNVQEPIRIYDKQVTQDVTRPSFVDSHSGFRASIRNGAVTIPPISLGEPLKVECEAFIDAVLSGATKCESDGRFGLDVVHVLEAIDRSAKAGGREEKVTQ